MMEGKAAELFDRLRRNPGDVAAYQALREIYVAEHDYPSAVNLIEGWAGVQSNPERACSALLEAGDLAFGQLGDKTRALALYTDAFDRFPASLDAAERLLYHADQSGDPQLILDALRKRGSVQLQRGDSEGLADTEYRIGELYERAFQRPDKAIAHYQKAIESNPRFVVALYATRTIYTAMGRHQHAAELLEQEVDAEQDPDRRLGLLRELAHLRGEVLGDYRGAASALNKASLQAPNDLGLLHEYATLLLAQGNEMPESDDGRAANHEAASVMVQMAHKCPPEHALAYCASALDASPAHEEALDLLEYLTKEHGRKDLLPARWVAYLHVKPTGSKADRRRRELGYAYLDAGQREDAMVCFEPLLQTGDGDVAAVLLDLYRESGRTEQVVEALLVLQAHGPGDVRAPRLAELLSELRSLERHNEAMACAADLLHIAPAHQQAFDYLSRAYRNERRWSDLEQLHVATSRASGIEKATRVAYLEEAARICEGELGDLEGAMDRYRESLTHDPSNASANTQLARLLRDARRWDELANHLDSQVLALDEQELKVAVLRELANIHRYEREDARGAIRALRWILQIAPKDARARDDLAEALLTTEGGAGEAAGLLEERLSELEGQPRIDLAHRLAEIFEDRLRDDVRAFEAARGVLEFDPANLRALDRMERLDAKNERYARLLETLAYRSELTEGEEKADVLTRVGEVARDKLEDLDRAADAFGSALDVAPHRRDLLDALSNVFIRSGSYDRLVARLESRITREADSSVRREFRRRVARIQAEHLSDHAGAKASWEALLAEPAKAEDEEALTALADYARGAGDATALEGLLARRSLVCEDPGVQPAVFFELAEVREGIGQAEAAKEALAQLLEINPEHLRAVDKMVALSEATDDWAALATALRQKISLETNHELQLELARRLTGLCLDERESLGSERAIDALNAWRELDPTDEEPRDKLLPLLEDKGDSRALVEVLDELSGLTIGEDSRTFTRRSAATLYDELGDFGGAWSRLEPIIEEDEAADAQLRKAAKGAGELDALVGLFAAHGQRAQSEGKTEYSIRRWLDAAEGYASLRDHRAALEATLRAFAQDLESTKLLSSVETRAAATGAWERLEQVYGRVVRAASSAEERAGLLARYSKFIEAEKGDLSAAFEKMLGASHADPARDDLLEEAERLAHVSKRTLDLFPLYDVRKSQASDDQGRAEALLRGARQAFLAKDLDAARGFYAQAAVLSLRTPTLIQALHDSARTIDADGDYVATRTLCGMYLRIAEEAEEDMPSSSELMRRAAQLYLEVMGNSEKAFELLKLSTEILATQRNLADLDALGRELARGKALDKHYTSLIEDAIDPDSVQRVSHRQGVLREDVLEDLSLAAETWERLLRLKPDDALARRQRLVCMRKAGDDQKLLNVLEEEARRSGGETKIALLTEIAFLWERALSNPYEAIDTWKRVLRLDSRNKKAKEAIEALEAKQPVVGDFVPMELVVEAHFEDVESQEIAPGEKAMQAAESVAEARAAAPSFEAAVVAQPPDARGIESLLPPATQEFGDLNDFADLDSFEDLGSFVNLDVFRDDGTVEIAAGELGAIKSDESGFEEVELGTGELEVEELTDDMDEVKLWTGELEVEELTDDMDEVAEEDVFEALEDDFEEVEAIDDSSFELNADGEFVHEVFQGAVAIELSSGDSDHSFNSESDQLLDDDVVELDELVADHIIDANELLDEELVEDLELVSVPPPPSGSLSVPPPPPPSVSPPRVSRPPAVLPPSAPRSSGAPPLPLPNPSVPPPPPGRKKS